MEREDGDGFVGGYYPSKLARRSYTTGSTILPRHDSTAIAATTNLNKQLQLQPQALPPLPSRPPCVIQEQDQYMPIANVIRIMRRILPPYAKISDEAKETVQECVSEYISFITGEANERCHREQRKTITAEDVIWAMGKLGFDDYVEPLSVYLNRYREGENERTASHKEPMPIPRRGPAAAPVLDHYGLFGVPTVPCGPILNMGPHHGIFDPSIGGLLREGSGSASGSGSGYSFRAQANNNNNNYHLPGSFDALFK